MRSLWLLFLLGLATGFISEKLFVSSQSPFSMPDDLYLEGQSSGLPIDDEDVDDDGSGSGSGDYDSDDLLNVFLNFTKTIFNDMAPFLPQPTADPTHSLPTTAAGSQDQTTPNIFPTDDNRAKEVPTADWFMTNNNPSSTSMPPSETTATEFSIDISVTEDTDMWDVSTIKEIEEEFMIRKDVNNGVVSSDGGSRYMNAPEQVTSENTWEKKEVLAAVIACGVIGFLCAVVLLILLVYRLKKKDEGSYDLGDTKLSTTAYQKAPTKEFYA